MTDKMKWIKLTSCSQQYQADMLIQTLKDADIPAMSQGPQAGIFGYGFGASTPQGILIMVPSDKHKEAQRILEQSPHL